MIVRSAYRLLVKTKRRREGWLKGRAEGSNPASECKAWQRLWKTDVPSKLRVFLWRLARHSLPTADVRYHRQRLLTVFAPFVAHEIRGVILC
jgi:hypothetical protein